VQRVPELRLTVHELQHQLALLLARDAHRVAALLLLLGHVRAQRVDLGEVVLLAIVQKEVDREEDAEDQEHPREETRVLLAEIAEADLGEHRAALDVSAG